jgi:hypothetical protein
MHEIVHALAYFAHSLASLSLPKSVQSREKQRDLWPYLGLRMRITQYFAISLTAPSRRITSDNICRSRNEQYSTRFTTTIKGEDP